MTRLSCPKACGIFPDQGSNPASPALAGGFPTTEPPGKPPEMQFLKSQINYFLICSLVHYFLVDTFGPQIPRAAGRAGERMAGGPGGATWERQPERSSGFRAAHPPLPPSPPAQPTARENSRTRGGNNGRKCRRKWRLHPCQPWPAPWTACYFLPSTSFWVIKYPHLPDLYRPWGQPF